MKLTVYACKFCNNHFIMEDWDEFGNLEEALWGHVQMDHEAIFEEAQDLDTPDMINECYDVTVKDSNEI